MEQAVSAVAAAHRVVWSSGDWDAVSEIIAGVGRHVIERAGITAGTDVLDVGTGNGRSVAIPAARLGANVVASDITSSWFETGRRLAGEAGVDVEWVEANVEELPFDDGTFDVVTSTFGHMFAPRHAVAAAEMARVCRPTGTIATTTWLPVQYTGAFFRLVREFVPPPPAFAGSPLEWGARDHVREMFEPHGFEVTFDEGTVVVRRDSVEAFATLFEENFGPLVTARNAAGDRWDEFHPRYLDVISEFNRATDGTAEIHQHYLLTVARRA